MTTRQKSTEKDITLPVTEDAFDELIRIIMKKYKFTDQEHTIAVVSNRIQMMPADQAHTNIQYLADCVTKSLAYSIARHKATILRHQHEVNELDKVLTADPLDQQALDALTRAVSEGSELAKAVLSKYRVTSIEKAG